MSIKLIRVSSPIDAGIPIDDSEHEAYCELVVEAVAAYYNCLVYVDLCEVNTTEVSVTFLPGSFRTDSAQIVATVRAIAQNVWEQGGFWE